MFFCKLIQIYIQKSQGWKKLIFLRINILNFLLYNQVPSISQTKLIGLHMTPWLEKCFQKNCGHEKIKYFFLLDCCKTNCVNKM